MIPAGPTLPRVVIVTGTDTDVGKTIATAALAVISVGRVGVYKPVQTGVDPHAPADMADVQRLSGVTDVQDGFRLVDPLAPTTAGRLKAVTLPGVSDHARTIEGLARDRDQVIVEGAGGLLVGLDSTGAGLCELATELTTPFGFVIVCRAGLGTLNHTALTVEALRRRQLPALGLIIGSWPSDPDLAARCNLTDLPEVTGLPVLARIPAGAGRLTREAFRAAAPTWFAPS